MNPTPKRPEPHAEVGRRVKAEREAAGISQAELCRLAKIHATYLSRLELGKLNPGADHMVRLAFALGVNPAVFIVDIIPNDLRGRRTVKRSDTDETSS